MQVRLARGRSHRELREQLQELIDQGFEPVGDPFEVEEFWSVEDAAHGRRTVLYQAVRNRWLPSRASLLAWPPGMRAGN
ncbi:MAG: hypothetical protein ACOY3Y_19935 [Acidobacteriota bacterium]